MRRVPGAVLVVALLVASAAAGPVVAQESPDSTSMTMRVQVQADGDARWVVTTRFELDDEDDRAAFAELREDFEDGDADVAFSIDAFRNAAAAASSATDRRMNVTEVDRSSRVVEAANASTNRTVGVLRLSFTWTDFARQADERLVVGDAFNTTRGTWLPALTADQRLVIEPPPGYGVDDAPLHTNPDSLDDGILTWTGPQEFAAGDLTITYVRGGDGNPWPSWLEGLGPPANLLPVVLGGLVLGAILVGVYLWNRYREEDGEGVLPRPGQPSGDGGVAADDAVADEGEPAGEADDAGAAAASEGVDPALLSDEERVVHLLERNGGRMKQADIVTETGWSNAKVSQLLSSMADEEEVEKLRIGRENLISLPNREPPDEAED